MKTVLLLGFLAAATASQASAQEQNRWLWIGDSAGGNKISIDRETLMQKDGAVTAWVRTTYTGSRPAGIPPNAANTSARVRFQCEAMTVTMLSYIVYTADGESLDSSNVQGTTSPVIPESVNEMIWAVLCKQ